MFSTAPSTFSGNVVRQSMLQGFPTLFPTWQGRSAEEVWSSGVQPYPLPLIADVAQARKAVDRHDTLALLSDKKLFVGAYLSALQVHLEKEEKKKDDKDFRVEWYNTEFEAVPAGQRAAASGGLIVHCRKYVLDAIADWLVLGVRPLLLRAWEARHNVVLHIKERCLDVKITDNADIPYNDCPGPEIAHCFVRDRVEPALTIFFGSLGVHVEATNHYDKYRSFERATWKCVWRKGARLVYPFPPVPVSPRPLTTSTLLYSRYVKQDWTQDIELRPEHVAEGAQECIRVSSGLLALHGGTMLDAVMSSGMAEGLTRSVSLPATAATVKLYAEYLYRGQDAVTDALEAEVMGDAGAADAGEADVQDDPIDVVALFRLADYLNCDDLRGVCVNAFGALVHAWSQTDVPEEQVKDALRSVKAIMAMRKGVSMKVATGVAQLGVFLRTTWKSVKLEEDEAGVEDGEDEDIERVD